MAIDGMYNGQCTTYNAQHPKLYLGPSLNLGQWVPQKKHWKLRHQDRMNEQLKLDEFTALMEEADRDEAPLSQSHSGISIYCSIY